MSRKSQCNRCRYSATCLTYPYRWTFVHASQLDLTRCKGCGRVWDAKDALVGEKKDNETQMVDLSQMRLMPTPPCGEWQVGEAWRSVDRCLKCSPYPRTTASESAGNYLPFTKSM